MSQLINFFALRNKVMKPTARTINFLASGTLKSSCCSFRGKVQSRMTRSLSRGRQDTLFAWRESVF